MSNYSNRFTLLSLALTTVAITACGGGSASLPATSLQAMQLPDRTGSWIAPNAASGDLLYVTDLNKNAVFIYSYPAAKLVGMLKGFSAPHGDCTDKRGDVYVADGKAQQILEYARAGTAPIATLKDPGFFPSSCAVDPTTGNLAVTNFPMASTPGNVVIYRHARGAPQPMPPGIFFVYFAAYDRNGNLFVDGTKVTHAIFEFAELPAGKTKWRSITLEHDFAFPGAIQWLGKELVVGDQVNISGPSTIYEFSLAGRMGKQIGATPLLNSCDVLGYRIDGARLIAADDCGSKVRYFDFPAGGNSTKAISRDLSQPIGIAISYKR
jgi:DNA-binding beta-propeller fold protein YncE